MDKTQPAFWEQRRTWRERCEIIAEWLNATNHPARIGGPATADLVWRDCTPNGEMWTLFQVWDAARREHTGETRHVAENGDISWTSPLSAS